MGKGSQTTTSQTTSAPDSNAYASYLNILNRANSVGQTPYQPYTGELVAGVNPQENLGIGNVNNYAGAAQPAIGNAITQAQTASAPLTAAGIQTYMNPYTQQVVNATQNQFNNQNQQALQQVKGNAIAQGALGGNREAIAEGNTLAQLQLSQAPTIANLYNQGYNQAVNTAVGQQQLGLQGASTMGNLGVAGQSAGLQGAQSQIGAGQLQQNTQQALDQALLQQYQQQQAYPYQQLSWLAGLDTGVGSQMGGTSSGTTTAPAPSALSQIAGLGSSVVGGLGATGAFGSAGWLAPLMAFSDKRLKENIKEIGRTHDGQKIYRFNYKGDKTTRIGLMAQEVEKKHPDAVHEIDGYKIVDYDEATKHAARARGGVVPGFAVGGVPSQPWGNAPSWFPTQNIAHGSGAPHIAPPSIPNDQSQNKNQAAAIGSLAKTLKDSVDNNPQYQTPGSVVPNAYGPTSVGGPSGPAPLNGVVAPLGYAADPSVAGALYARGGGVAGYADGGTPDDAPASFDDRFSAAYPQYTPPPAQDTVVNPDQPYRLTDPADMQQWRNGVDRTNHNVPEDNSTDELPKSNGVAPSTTPLSPTEMAYTSGNNPTSGLPSEIALGYSGDGVAPRVPAQSNGFDWGANNKLWPALMSAGFGMMASRSPFAAVGIGEGGQAGMATYAAEQQREMEAQKAAQQMEIQAHEQARLDQQAKINAANQTITLGPNGEPSINKNFITAKQQLERDWQPKLQKIGVNDRGDDIMGVYDPNTKRATDLQGNPITVDSRGVVHSLTGGPTSSLQPQLGAPATSQQPATPSSPNNVSASSGAQAPVQVASTDPNFVPSSPAASVIRHAGYQTVAQVAPHAADPTAAPGSEASRDTQFLSGIAQSDPGYALALQKAADYQLDPGKYASLRKDRRQRFIDDVFRYDPNYNPQNVGLIYRAQTAFLPGTKTGDTIGSFNTAISHLDLLKELYHTLNNPDQRIMAKIRNDWNTYWKGEAIPNTVQGIAQMVAGEVVKATVGAQNALGDREEANKTVNRDLATGQADDVIDKWERLMGGKLETAKFQYEHSTGLKNFDDKFLLPRSQAVMKLVTAESQSRGANAQPLSGQDRQALDWANANPNDPRAAQIKKKLGVQ